MFLGMFDPPSWVFLLPLAVVCELLGQVWVYVTSTFSVEACFWSDVNASVLLGISWAVVTVTAVALSEIPRHKTGNIAASHFPVVVFLTLVADFLFRGLAMFGCFGLTWEAVQFKGTKLVLLAYFPFFVRTLFDYHVFDTVSPTWRPRVE